MKKKIQYPLRPHIRLEKGRWVVDFINTQNVWREQESAYMKRNRAALAWVIEANHRRGVTGFLYEPSEFAHMTSLAPNITIPARPTDMLDVLYNLLGRSKLTINIPKSEYLRSAFGRAMKESPKDGWPMPFSREEGRPIPLTILDRATRAGIVHVVGWSNNSINLGRYDRDFAKLFAVYDPMVNPQDYR